MGVFVTFVTFLGYKMAIQSFWTHPELLKFVKYGELLAKNDGKKTKINLKNWKKGKKMMQQLGIGYGIDYNPDPPFQLNSDITWIELENGTIIGLSDESGDHWKVGGKYVFSAKWLDYMVGDYTDKNKAKKFICTLISKFDGEVL